jgi:VanZ family protein
MIFFSRPIAFLPQTRLNSWNRCYPRFSGITAEQFAVIHLLIRKLAHWSEYFIFSLLLILAVHGQFKRKVELRRAVWIAAAVFMYALSDELHQLFVPSRTASLADAALDSFGGICGILWTYLGPKGKSVAVNAAPAMINATASVKNLDKPGTNRDH